MRLDGRRPGALSTPLLGVATGPASTFVRFFELLDTLCDHVVRRSQLGKSKLDAVFARRELDRIWLELGEQSSELARRGRVAVPVELKGLLARARELEERLHDHEREVARLRREIASET